MAAPLRVGILGLTHDHVWSNLEELAAVPDAQLVAAADPHPQLLEKFSGLYDRPVYPAYEALLEEEQLDAVYLYADNAAGVELARSAAQRGLAILVEKPLAHCLEGAEQMLASAYAGGAPLMVNWPFAWWPQMQHAQRLVEEGRIGTPWQVKYRAAHNGPENLGCSEFFCDWLFDPERNGAGALMDYCCYGALLARRMLGVPARVTAAAVRASKENITAEDNAVILMTYPRGLAISEASWSQVGNLTSYMTTICGTQGTLLIEPRREGGLWLATEEQPEGVKLDVPQPSPEMQSASAHFAHCVLNNQPFTPLCDARVGRDAQEILEAGLMAAQEGAEVSLPLKSWMA